MSFPDLPRWATGGGASITEPSESEKDNGWVAGTAPAAGEMNWLQNQTYDALVHVRNTMRTGSWLRQPELVNGTIELYGAVADNFGARSVICGAQGRSAYSPGDDMQEWIAVNHSTSDDFRCAAYANRFFLGGESGRIRTSADGITWTSATPDASFSDVFYAAAYFSGLSLLGGTDGVLQATGNDPSTGWTQVTGPSSGLDTRTIVHNGSPIAAGSLIVTAGESGSIVNYTYSPLTFVNSASAAGGYSDSFLGGCWDGDQFVLVGENAEIQTSPDAVNWTSQPATGIDSSIDLTDIVYDSVTGLYVAVGRGASSTGYVFTTSDVTGAWATSAALIEGLEAIATNDKGIVIVGDNEALFRSNTF